MKMLCSIGTIFEAPLYFLGAFCYLINRKMQTQARKGSNYPIFTQFQALFIEVEKGEMEEHYSSSLG